MQASLGAQPKELTASFSAVDTVEEPKPEKKHESDLAGYRASQKEISKLVDKLPEPLKDQMDELFKARYTRIQKLDLDKIIDG